MASPDVQSVLTAAAAAAAPWAETAPRDRATVLRSVAAAIDEAGDELVPIGERETHIPAARLGGEVARTSFQLRLFADVLDDGAFCEAIIDHADPDFGPTPRPDIRRVLVGVGPVVVYAASNFPFAFSVAGGDTASALAAGCPVIVKAHPGHPELSDATAAAVHRGLAAPGAEPGLLGLVHDDEDGLTALDDPRVHAGAFTGSLAGGRALFDRANRRAEPIPFFAEMGSVNPVVVTAAALAERSAEIVSGYVASFTMGVGQLCTKPGVVFLPSGHGLDAALTDAVAGAAGGRLLTGRIDTGFASGLAERTALPGVRVLHAGTRGQDTVAPTLLVAPLATARDHADVLLEECFGPVSVVVEYDSLSDLLPVLRALPGHLTATVQGTDAELPALTEVLAVLADRVGRVIYNGWPTGVSVTWAMQHGGPYPATTATGHTSVGATAIRRFLRPVAYQGFPDAALPPALREANPLMLPRRVDGAWTSG